MQRWIGSTLDRRVSLRADPAVRSKVVIHLLGGIEITAAHIEIGAPGWSAAPHTLQARDARMTLRYADLWRAGRSEPLHVHALRAAQLDGQFERLADGRASWQFGKKTDTPDTAEPATHLPSFGRLQVDAGSLIYRDALLAADVDGRFSLGEGLAGPGAAPDASRPAPGLQFNAKGSYRRLSLRIDVKAAGLLPLVADDAATTALPVTVDAHLGRASVSFKGTATDALHLRALKGRFIVQGPSLAAVGDPLRVTLPTTATFRAEGLLAKEGVVWNTVLDQVSIGASRLAGAFTYDPRAAKPVLSGRLTGSRLMLADLGPAVGAPVRDTAVPVAAVAAASAAKGANANQGRVLPDREFDLPALRAMNANVLVDIDNFDLGSGLLQPLKPLRTHLMLTDGVLVLRDIDARTGQGHLGGLESWIHQTRADNAPPYASGSLNGQARVARQGKSTAAILGSLRGGVRMQLVDGTVSHLAVEAAGLDVAQGLGMLVKGDDALPILCAVVDLVAEQGILRPRVLVLDTRDSTIWIDGSLSLATEALDLRVVITPNGLQSARTAHARASARHLRKPGRLA